MGKRNTQTERAAVEAMAGRIKRTTAELGGREITADAARLQAARIAERSDRERAEKKGK